MAAPPDCARSDHCPPFARRVPDRAAWMINGLAERCDLRLVRDSLTGAVPPQRYSFDASRRSPYALPKRSAFNSRTARGRGGQGEPRGEQQRDRDSSPRTLPVPGRSWGSQRASSRPPPISPIPLPPCSRSGSATAPRAGRARVRLGAARCSRSRLGRPSRLAAGRDRDED